MTNYKRIALATLTLIALTVSIAAQPAQDDPQKARPRTTTTSSQDKDKNQPAQPDRLIRTKPNARPPMFLTTSRPTAGTGL